jgi:rhomboid family GlyGly-CTERM serine protease
MITLIRRIFAPEKLPWAFLVIIFGTIAIQLNTGWRDALIYDRAAIATGQVWRIWTGHMVHFGWPHFLADTGLFLLLGRVLEREHPIASRIALALMPLAIAFGIYVFDPAMPRYAGLSGMNVGLLVFLACKGWQKSWTDWFWPAVLGIHALEVVLETTQKHGVGGAMIPFDDPSVHVATSAHIAGASFGLVLWLSTLRKRVSQTGKPVTA